MRASFIIICVLLPFSAGVVNADTINIPTDYPTIQQGIDAAVNGDTVLVAPGTYVENIDFLGKAITVMSEQGPSSTVIDGNETTSCVRFTSGEDRNSILQGFKITNGWGTLHEWQPGKFLDCGAGIYCNDSSPTIRKNTINKNVARRGGGIFGEDTSILILDNFFTLNRTYKHSSHGAGIYLENIAEVNEVVISGNLFLENGANKCGGAIGIEGFKTAVISDNQFVQNRAKGNGGAIWCSTHSRMTISNNVFDVNEALSSGGAIYSSGPNFIFTENNFNGNISEGYAGAIHASGANITITNNIINGNTTVFGGAGIVCDGGGHIAYNIITNNTTSNYGGGIDCDDGWTIASNLITGNSAGKGGAVYCYLWYFSPTVLQNNIICGNNANDYGGGLYVTNYDPHDFVQVTNNTICDNTAGIAGGGLFTDAYTHTVLTKVRNSIFWNNSAPTDKEIHDTGGSLELSYCDIEDSAYSTYPGCFSRDPLFVNQPEGDYHLTYDSPCRGAGLNTALYLPVKDFEGDPRIAWGATVDIGADEFYTHLYITGDQTPGGDIRGKFVGLPGTSPVSLFIGLGGVRPTPLPTMYGDLWLLPPRLPIPLVPIPTNGILAIPTTIPASPPAPYDIPMQGLVGLNSDSLTNLCVLEVR